MRCGDVWKTLVGGIALGASLTACSLAPPYLRPQTAITLAEAAGSSKPLAVETSAWWRQLNDPVLNTWVARSLENNFTLQAAMAAVEQARQQAAQTHGALWPQIDVTASKGRVQQPPPVAGIGVNETLYYSTADAALLASWQPDVFGRLRSLRQVAEAEYAAQASDAMALQHSLIAEVVRARALLGILQQRVNVQQASLRSSKQSLTTVERRYRLGLESTQATDVLSGRDGVAAAEASLLALQQALQEQQLATDGLLGQPPGTVAAQYAALTPLSEGLPLPQRLPVSLLDRRPDVRASELRLIAANAGIGVAIADMLPGVTLSGRIGYSGEDFSALFDPDRLAGQLLVSLTSRLFAGGQLKAALKAQRANVERLQAQYIADVLAALQEGEQALVQVRLLQRQVIALQRSQQAARDADTVALARYRRGLGSWLQVLDSQRRRQTAEQSLLQAQASLWSARTALYLAIGGDWLPQEDMDGDA